MIATGQVPQIEPLARPRPRPHPREARGSGGRTREGRDRAGVPREAIRMQNLVPKDEGPITDRRSHPHGYHNTALPREIIRTDLLDRGLERRKVRQTSAQTMEAYQRRRSAGARGRPRVDEEDNSWMQARAHRPGHFNFLEEWLKESPSLPQNHALRAANKAPGSHPRPTNADLPTVNQSGARENEHAAAAVANQPKLKLNQKAVKPLVQRPEVDLMVSHNDRQGAPPSMTRVQQGAPLTPTPIRQSQSESRVPSKMPESLAAANPPPSRYRRQQSKISQMNTLRPRAVATKVLQPPHEAAGSTTSTSFFSVQNIPQAARVPQRPQIVVMNKHRSAPMLPSISSLPHSHTNQVPLRISLAVPQITRPASHQGHTKHVHFGQDTFYSIPPRASATSISS